MPIACFPEETISSMNYNVEECPHINKSVHHRNLNEGGLKDLLPVGIEHINRSMKIKTQGYFIAQLFYVAPHPLRAGLRKSMFNHVIHEPSIFVQSRVLRHEY